MINKIEEPTHLTYSKWILLGKLYTAKEQYYKTGTSDITDIEYDNLEQSFIAIHGKDVLFKYTTIGYDKQKHELIKDELKAMKMEHEGFA